MEQVESPKRMTAAPRRVLLIAAITAIAAMILAEAAVASDGGLEISQTCATQTGCFAGDTAGFPVRINGTAGRSYRLTSDLIVPDENTDGITIASSDLAIDLNGFTIIRNTCQGVGHVNCTPSSGTGSGIERVDLTQRGISVQNGAITGMGNYGILPADQAVVTNVRVRWNRLDGVSVAEGAIVSGVAAYQNGDTGIRASFGSTVSGNTADGNGSYGIVAGTSSVIGNSVVRNGGDGIAAAYSTVSQNTAFQNGGDGIRADFGIVSNNTSTLNSQWGIRSVASTITNNATGYNTLSGIYSTGASNIRDNTSFSNQRYGLELSGSEPYRGNSMNANTLGSVLSGTSFFPNSCDGVSC